MLKCNDGFSLLEAIVAMAIISMAAAAALGLTAELARTAKASQEKLAAEALADVVLNTAIAEQAVSGTVNQSFASPFEKYRFTLQTRRIGPMLRAYSVVVSGRRSEVRSSQVVLDTLSDQ